MQQNTENTVFDSQSTIFKYNTNQKVFFFFNCYESPKTASTSEGSAPPLKRKVEKNVVGTPS